VRNRGARARRARLISRPVESPWREDAGAAVGGFPGEGKALVPAGQIPCPTQLGSVMYLGPSSTRQGHSIGATEAVARLNSVLFVKADFVFVAEGYAIPP